MIRPHPTKAQLRKMSIAELLSYAKREEKCLADQKQTAVPRLLNELTRRLTR